MGKPTLKTLAPVLLVLALAVQLRLTFYQGVVHTDDLVYSQLAYRLTEGVSPLAEPRVPGYAVARIGLYGPVALVYAVFGVSEITTIAWPFLCSLLGVVAAWGIGRLVHSEAAGLFAAFGVAILPAHVAAATALLGDGPMTAMSMTAVWLLLLADRAAGRKALLLLVGSLVCFGVGLLIKPLILLVLPFALVWLTRRSTRGKVMMVGTALLAGVAIAGYLLYFGVSGAQAQTPLLVRLGATASDLWRQLVVGQREFVWVAPLWIVAVATALASRAPEARPLVWWLGLTFLYGEIGSRTLVSYTPIVWYDAATAGRHFLLIAAPAMVLTGVHLARGIDAGTGRVVTVVAAAIAAAGAWWASGAPTITWGVTQLAPANHPLANLSALAGGIVILGGLISPAWAGWQTARARAAAVLTLVSALGVASITLSYQAAVEFRNPWTETLPEALALIEAEPPAPIYVQHELTGLRLDFLSGYRLGFDSSVRRSRPDARIHLAPTRPDDVDDGWVLIDEHDLAIASPTLAVGGPDYLHTPPPEWWPVAELGPYRGARLRVLRVSSATAAEDLAAARAAVASVGTPLTYRRLFLAASSAGEFCEAVEAWFQYRRLAGAQDAALDAVPALTECVRVDQRFIGPPLLRNPSFTAGVLPWLTHPESDATIRIDRDVEGTHVWYSDFRGGNWSVMSQEQVLQPDTPYLFEVTIRTTVPVVALYLQVDEGQFFERRSYPTWTTLQYVFVTPKWVLPRSAIIQPVLTPFAGEVWLKHLRLAPLRVPPPQ